MSEPQEDPWPWTRWVMRHPVLWGGVTFVAVALMVFSASALLWLAVLLGGAVGLIQWLLWRTDGPGRAWRARILAKDRPT